MEPEFLDMLKAIIGTMWLFVIAIYIFWAYCLHRIAKKTGTPNGWFAYIPILNYYLMCKVAGKPGWWLILLFLPFIQIIFVIIICIEIAKALNKPVWMGVVTLLPLIGLIVWAYLAFSKEEKLAAPEEKLATPKEA
jgi:hypothetical protein